MASQEVLQIALFQSRRRKDVQRVHPPYDAHLETEHGAPARLVLAQDAEDDGNREGCHFYWDPRMGHHIVRIVPGMTLYQMKEGFPTRVMDLDTQPSIVKCGEEYFLPIQSNEWMEIDIQSQDITVVFYLLNLGSSNDS